MALLNVRLDAEDVRRVADLRRDGVQISEVVREAIRARHADRGRRAARDAGAVMARIYADHPDTPDVRARGYDLRDRRAVRRVIAARLQRRRP
jgi:hypothetical protein